MPSSHSTPLARSILCVLAVILAAALPAVVRAQTAGTATITGQVLDGTTNQPVADAVVAIVELRRSVKTDSAGSFTLSGLAPGMYRWSVIRLGYVPLDQQMDFSDADHFRIGIMPRPVVLEGVTAAVTRPADAFRRRLNSARVPVRLLTQEVLAESGATTAEQIVATRAQLTDCPAAVTEASGAVDCVSARGRAQPVQVFIDENPALGGIFQLAAFHPSELYAIELWNGGTEVRAFTNRFIERLADGSARFTPRDW